jgi:hypothetical protein
MVLPKDDLDSYIESALRVGTGVTPAQKQRAWDALREKALHQAVLPAPVEARPLSLMERVSALSVRCWQVFNLFVIEEGQFERAYRNQRRLAYAGASAPGRHGAQLAYPLRFNFVNALF